jgi:hypothetical protein
MSKFYSTLSLVIFLTVTSLSFGQTIKEYKSHSIDIDKLPEYVVIASETAGRILSPNNLFINTNKSDDKVILDKFKDILTGRKNLNIRNHTDLLNAMSAFGFEYKDHFGIGAGVMVNLVFQKKEKYRKSE